MLRQASLLLGAPRDMALLPCKARHGTALPVTPLQGTLRPPSPRPHGRRRAGPSSASCTEPPPERGRRRPGGDADPVWHRRRGGPLGRRTARTWHRAMRHLEAARPRGSPGPGWEAKRRRGAGGDGGDAWDAAGAPQAERGAARGWARPGAARCRRWERGRLSAHPGVPAVPVAARPRLQRRAQTKQSPGCWRRSLTPDCLLCRHAHAESRSHTRAYGAPPAPFLPLPGVAVSASGFGKILGLTADTTKPSPRSVR